MCPRPPKGDAKRLDPADRACTRRGRPALWRRTGEHEMRSNQRKLLLTLVVLGLLGSIAG
jgi:hypothetical protein